MKLKLLSVVVIGTVLFVLSSSVLRAQVVFDASKLWIRAHGTTSASLTYGNRIGNNTAGIDSDKS